MVYIFRNRSQRSRPIRLRAGKVYFVEVIQKEGGGGDHVSVGVRVPRSRSIRPISKKNLYRRRPGKRVLLFLSLLMSLQQLRERRLKKMSHHH